MVLGDRPPKSVQETLPEERVPLGPLDTSAINGQSDMCKLAVTSPHREHGIGISSEHLDTKRANQLNEKSEAESLNNMGSKYSRKRFYKVCSIVSTLLLVAVLTAVGTYFLTLSRVVDCTCPSAHHDELVETTTTLDVKSTTSPPVVKEITPSLLLFLDKDELSKHRDLRYKVVWKKGKHGFVKGNINHTRSNISIVESGIYSISSQLQMDIGQYTDQKICHLILQIYDKNKHEEYKLINSKNSVHMINDSLPYQFPMSFTIIQELTKGQVLSVHIQPLDYLSIGEERSFISIHMVKENKNK